MKIADILNKTEKTLFSFEIVPPLLGHSANSLYEKISLLAEFQPLNINITYHQDETVYKQVGDDVLTKKLVRKRPGTVALAAAIRNRFPNILTVPHLICGGMTAQDIENVLIDLNFLEIDNILLLRGDPPKGEKYFIQEPGGYKHTIDMVKQIMNLNKGIYLDGDLKNTESTHFSVGVAGYPEKHAEAANLETDIKYLKDKVDAGAEYIITQMFFDNAKFFEWERKCREVGINVPIIPGIKPLSKKRDLDTIPLVFHLDIPTELSTAIINAPDDAAVYQIGIEWAIAQSKELKQHGVPLLHYFSVGRTENVREIIKAVF